MSNIEIATILSNRTKEGMVELVVDSHKVQMDISKAREVFHMLGEAIEAAISDTIIYKFLKERIGLDEDKAAIVLLDFRELRQGSKDTVYKQ
jgi:hypothetical protein